MNEGTNEQDEQVSNAGNFEEFEVESFEVECDLCGLGEALNETHKLAQETLWSGFDYGL